MKPNACNHADIKTMPIANNKNDRFSLDFKLLNAQKLSNLLVTLAKQQLDHLIDYCD